MVTSPPKKIMFCILLLSLLRLVLVRKKLVDSLPDVVDGPCLINSMDKFMESTFEIEYE